MRAESEGEVGATENEEAVSEPASEAVVDAEAGAALETEPEPEEKKPPRKPRIKLGDVMGVTYSINPLPFLFSCSLERGVINWE